MSEEFRLSVSKTKTFLSCKKKFHYTYIQKLPRKEWSFHVLGHFCHKTLELFHNAYIKDNSVLPFNVEMGKAFNIAFQEYGAKMTPKMKQECYQLIDQYLRIVSHDKEIGNTINVLAMEKKFSFPIADNIIINGAIDKIQLDADNILHLADYKTTKDKRFLKEDWFQLQTYGFVMLQENPDLEKVRCSYILMRHNFEHLTKEFSAKELWEVKDKYLEYAKQMEEETEFPANPTVLCQYCDHLDLCVQGKEIVDKIKPSSVFGEVSW